MKRDEDKSTGIFYADYCTDRELFVVYNSETGETPYSEWFSFPDAAMEANKRNVFEIFRIDSNMEAEG